MNNNENAPALHAHVSTESRDCDGGHGSNYISRMNPAEIAHAVEANGVNDFSDLMFKERVLGGAVSFHSDCTVKVTEDGFNVVEVTEEGYRAVDVVWCEDHCADESGQYDQYAEMAGY